MACGAAPNFSAVWDCPDPVSSPPNNSSDPVVVAAAEWLAKRDRGLSPAEQDAYLQWLREKPSHGTAVTQLEGAWRALDQLRKWRPAHSPHPNPDLLAPARRRPWRWVGFIGIAAAVVIVLGSLISVRTPGEQPSGHRAVIHPGPDRMTLEDGSIVELNAGAQVQVAFTAEERRVHLVRGEAHFAVAKNPARPFIVAADEFAVRAVGTAFSVHLEGDAVSVLVTEGKVRLDETSTRNNGLAGSQRELSQLVAGQQAVITRSDLADPKVEIRDFTPAEIDRALAWQGLRLEFVDMPLGDVVTEFNRYNVRKLIVGDRATAGILVGGNFRADNVDTFVRLLDLSFGVTATPRNGDLVLSRRR